MARLGRRQISSPLPGPSPTRTPSWIRCWGSLADQPAKRAQFVKGAEDEPDDLLYLFIRVELNLAGGAPEVADRQRKLQFAPLGAALATLVHALLQDMEFSFRQSSLQP